MLSYTPLRPSLPLYAPRLSTTPAFSFSPNMQTMHKLSTQLSNPQYPPLITPVAQSMNFLHNPLKLSILPTQNNYFQSQIPNLQNMEQQYTSINNQIYPNENIIINEAPKEYVIYDDYPENFPNKNQIDQEQDEKINNLNAQSQVFMDQQANMRNYLDQIGNDAEILRNEQAGLRTDNYYVESKARQLEQFNDYIMEEAEKLRAENLLLKQQNLKLQNDFQEQRRLHEQLEMRQRITEQKQKEQEEKQRMLEDRQEKADIRAKQREKVLEREQAYTLQREKEIERRSELEILRYQKMSDAKLRAKEDEIAMIKSSNRFGDIQYNSLNNNYLQKSLPALGSQVSNMNPVTRTSYIVETFQRPNNVSSNIIPDANYTSNAGKVSTIPTAYENPNINYPLSQSVPLTNMQNIPGLSNNSINNPQTYYQSALPNLNGNQKTANYTSNPLDKLHQAETYLNQKTNIQREISSDVLKQNAELEMLQKKLNKLNKPVLLNLLYKASIHGDSAQAFHEKCDRANGTIVLIETTGGRRFGGYTSQSWAGDKIDKKDNEAFVFSLDNMEIYDIIPDQDAIGCYPKYGPVFFGCQIRVYDNFYLRGGTTYLKGLNYMTTSDFVLTGGEQNFGIKEMEVFEVTFG